MKTGGKWLYALVDGQKRLPEKGLRGTHGPCGRPMISKCGPLLVDHWAHMAGANCDPWHEGISDWHREWQDCVQEEFVEVDKGPHVADIVGIGNCVIELQHSSISADEIAERERFYGNMVWVFDATERFEMVTVGRRTFFAFRRTKHIEACSKPVFLDFGSVFVEVEAFSKAVAKMDGFGRTRSREWFADQYLSDRLGDGATPQSFRSSKQCRWYKHKRYERTEDASRWNDPETRGVVAIPKGSICMPLDWHFSQAGKAKVYEWERIVDELPQIANGWMKDGVDVMRRFLDGRIMILDGFLRLMPSSPERIKVNMTVTETKGHLLQVESHIAAGRIPILEDSTKQQLIKSAETHERQVYGGLLENQRLGKAVGDQQRKLF